MMLPKTCIGSRKLPKIKWFKRVAARLAKKGRRRMIYKDEDRVGVAEHEKYLERFYLISTPFLGVYIHRFWASDPDGLHDHPWSSISWVLEGGYKEEIAGLLEPEIRMPGSKHYRPAQEAHRISLLEGDAPGSCWTLFIRFRRKRLWGFYRGAEWVPAENQRRKK